MTVRLTAPLTTYARFVQFCNDRDIAPRTAATLILLAQRSGASTTAAQRFLQFAHSNGLEAVLRVPGLPLLIDREDNYRFIELPNIT